MAPPHVVDIRDPIPKFDKLAFRKYMNSIGRAYRHSAIELINCCRQFSAVSEQSFHQYVALSRVLQTCDKAIASATESREKTTQMADHDFDIAIHALNRYAELFLRVSLLAASGGGIVDRMERAKEMDLKNRPGKRTKYAIEESHIDVEFRIVRTLFDKHPTIAPQVLTRTSSLSEILWNFHRMKVRGRITLAQNPHFYRGPISSTEYVGGFNLQPVEDVEHNGSTIYVLTNDSDSRRVFLEIDKRFRAFDNVCNVNNTLIFKDIRGRIEGETIVRKSVRDAPLFWYSMEPAQYQPVVTGTTTDWIDLIRNLGDSAYTNLRISDKQSFESTTSVPTGVVSESATHASTLSASHPSITPPIPTGLLLIDAVSPVTITSVQPSEQFDRSGRGIRDSLISLKAAPALDKRISYFSPMIDLLINVLATEDDLKDNAKILDVTEIKIRKFATLVEKVVRKYEADGLVEDDLSPGVHKIFQSPKMKLRQFKAALKRRRVRIGEQVVEEQDGKILDLLEAFQAALAFDPHFSRCAEGIEVEVTDVNTCYDDDQTPLHVASQLGQHLVIGSLIDRGANVNAENAFKETPLSLASINGYTEVMSMLLSHGAQVNHMDSEQRMPLHEASKNGHRSAVELLFTFQAEPNTKNVHGWTALHLASRTGNLQVIEILLRHGASVDVVNKSHWTPLHLASQKGHVEVIEFLLVGGARVDERNADGETALHLAAYYGCVGVVEVLIRHHADRQVENKKQKTALDLASDKGNQDVMQILDQEAGIGGD